MHEERVDRRDGGARAGVARSRWAAIGAAIAVSLGGGAALTTSASLESGERPVFVPIAPCRIMDTRPGADNVGPRSTPIGAGETHTIDVLGTNGNCTIPADAVGVSMNVAAVEPSAGSYLTVFPAGITPPLAANLNWVGGQPPVSNAVTADLGDGGRLSFFNLAGTVHVTADVNGYYVDHGHDDRYARRVQTLVLDRFSLQPDGAVTLTTINNCVRPTTTFEETWLPLPLVVGSTILAVRLHAFDGSGTSVYTHYLVRSVLESIQIDPQVIRSVSGGALSIRVVEHDLSPTAAEVVERGESFAILSSFGNSTGNGVCQVEVDVLLP